MARTADIESFYRDHGSAVLGFLVSLTRDRPLAEDLMQDTFVKATRALGGYRGGSPRAWLFAIARSTFLDHTRKRPVHPTDSIDVASAEAADVEERDAIARVLAQLPERQRSALLLSDHIGLAAGEVGESLGISPGAARVLIHRARSRFRELYADEEGS